MTRLLFASVLYCIYNFIQLLAVSNGLSFSTVRTLGQLADKLNKSPGQMLHIVSEQLHKDPYKFEEVLHCLSIDMDTLRSTSLSANTQHMVEFKLHDRALHVYGEADRVDQFEQACLKGDIMGMGTAMRASHASCRDLYECSCPELDNMVTKCEQAGAVAARLTGAGWGGCLVALVKSADQLAKLPVLFTSEPADGIQLLKGGEVE